MPLPVLTWNIASETLISGSTPTYADFLNAVETKINASTHWRVNNKTLDAGNSRGFIEIAPVSTLAGVVDGRVLLLFSTGTVAGAGGTERPLQACRQPPWNINTSSLVCRMWAGMSPNAASTGSGPANDPWTSATPYGNGPDWTKLFPLNANIPAANDTLGLIESAEGFCLYWAVNGGANIQYLLAGRLLESTDGNSAGWIMNAAYATSDANVSATGWNSIASTINYPPIALASVQHSSGGSVKSWGVTIVSSVVYGMGRDWEICSSQVQGSKSGSAGAVLQSIIVGGGPYTGGAADGFLGTLRQMRWGPAAYRGQRLFSGGIEQAICLNYATAGTGPKVGGLWFDNFR